MPEREIPGRNLITSDTLSQRPEDGMNFEGVNTHSSALRQPDERSPEDKKIAVLEKVIQANEGRDSDDARKVVADAKAKLAELKPVEQPGSDNGTNTENQPTQPGENTNGNPDSLGTNEQTTNQPNLGEITGDYGQKIEGNGTKPVNQQVTETPDNNLPDHYPELMGTYDNTNQINPDNAAEKSDGTENEA